MNDLFLLKKWRIERDAGAFKEIVSSHAGMVYATCKRILRDPQDAEDVTQECFELLAEGRSKPDTQLGAWLHRVATNRALSRLRTDKRRRTREAKVTMSEETRSTIEWDEIYRNVDEAIEELPEKFRALLIASFLEGEKNVAIARKLEVSPSAVSYRIDKGIGLLRKSLRRKGIGVSLVSLSTITTSLAAEAAPVSLASTLGKLALAGAGPASAPTVSIAASAGTLIGGVLAMKKTMIGIALGVVLAGLAIVQLGGSMAKNSVVQAENPTLEELSPGHFLDALERQQSQNFSAHVIATVSRFDGGLVTTTEFDVIQGQNRIIMSGQTHWDGLVRNHFFRESYDGESAKSHTQDEDGIYDRSELTSAGRGFILPEGDAWANSRMINRMDVGNWLSGREISENNDLLKLLREATDKLSLEKIEDSDSGVLWELSVELASGQYSFHFDSSDEPRMVRMEIMRDASVHSDLDWRAAPNRRMPITEYKSARFVVSNIEYEDIDGQQFPVSGDVESFVELLSRTSHSVTHIERVNIALLPPQPDEVFQMKWPSGCVVFDMKTETKFLVTKDGDFLPVTDTMLMQTKLDELTTH